MADHSMMRLGKAKPRIDARTLKMAKYVGADLLPQVPASVQWSAKLTNPGMMLNDQLGDCLLPGTMVSAPFLQRAYRAPYSGPVVDIKTASGKELSVTANHAVLTSRGFMRAKFLKEGDHVISSGCPEAVSLGVGDDLDQTPARVEDTFSALRSRRVLSPMAMRHAIDFHGDEKFFKGDVEVVNVDSLLQHAEVAPLRQPKRQLQLLSGSRPSLSFHGQGPLASSMPAVGLTPPRSMSGRSTSLALLGRELVVPHQSRRPPVPDFYASTNQPSSDGGTVDSQLSRELLWGFPGLVAADKVVEIRNRVWSGHVYDTSTSLRWYMANGIVTHNCTCATAGHMIQVWTANNGAEVTLADASILQAYKDVSGYNGDPMTDQGANELNVLNYWRQTGIGTHKIDAFTVLDPTNLDHLKAAIWLFGGVYAGVALPNSAKNQDVWHVSIGGTDGDYSPGSWGGHAIPIIDFDANGLACVTWGQVKRLTWDWWKVYADECYALVSRDWVDSRPAPSGFDYLTLMTDLQGVTT